MAFTPITLTRRYLDADGRPASGTVRLTPAVPMVNGDTVVTAPVAAELNAEGDLGVQLMATTDPGTSPPGVAYRVDERIDDARRRVYFVQVPHDAGPSVDLATLDELTEPTPLVPVAPIVNTDGDSGRTIYVGAVEPSSPSPGDVWISLS